MAKQSKPGQAPANLPPSSPFYAPLYPTPPIEYREVWTTAVIFTTTTEALRKLVPEPLVPNPDNIVVISILDNFASGFGKYLELSMSTPVTFRGKPYNHSIMAMVDNDAALVAGREIWGVPKKMARINVCLKDAVASATVERAGIQIARLAVELNALGDASEMGAGVWDYTQHKYIPSVKKGAPPDVNQITSVHVTGVKGHRMFKGKATLEFGVSPVDPLHTIPVTAILGGVYSNADWTLPAGEVLYDYLK